MKIIQLVTVFNYGDAIGNDILAIDNALKTAGYTAVIMAMTIHEKLLNRALSIDFSDIEKEDLILFHKATGDDLHGRVARLLCRKILIYHNITPSGFFLPYDPIMAWNQWRGRRQLRR